MSYRKTVSCGRSSARGGLDLSTPEREYEQLLYPVAQVFEWTNGRMASTNAGAAMSTKAYARSAKEPSARFALAQVTLDAGSVLRVLLRSSATFAAKRSKASNTIECL